MGFQQTRSTITCLRIDHVQCFESQLYNQVYNGTSNEELRPPRQNQSLWKNNLACPSYNRETEGGELSQPIEQNCGTAAFRRTQERLHCLNPLLQNIFSQENGLMANPSKFQVLVLGSTDEQDFSFNIDGQQIQRCDDVDLLGL